MPERTEDGTPILPVVREQTHMGLLLKPYDNDDVRMATDGGMNSCLYWTDEVRTARKFYAFQDAEPLRNYGPPSDAVR